MLLILLFLLLLFSFFFFLGRPVQKILRLYRFKMDRNEIWQDCFSCKYASIDTESDFQNDVVILGGGHDIISRPPLVSTYANLLTYFCCVPVARRVRVKSVPDPPRLGHHNKCNAIINKCNHNKCNACRHAEQSSVIITSS